jgi:hypothetical protein
MKNGIKYFVLIALIYACNSSRYEEMGGVKVQRSSELCTNDSTTHWLVDIEAKTAADSTYLNTLVLQRKIEITSYSIPHNSTLFSLLSECCKGDSFKIILPADSFYLALGGVTPAFLEGQKEIKIAVWMRDKLNPLQYIAHKQAFENESIDSYIKSARWNGVRDSSTDIYYEFLKNIEVPIKSFKKAKFKYVIKTLNDNVIAYSKDEDPLVMDANDKSILLGIQFLSKKLGVGESLRAILPSSQAFGVQGNSKVPGYMPIVVELEMLEIME